tara:strand:+ start:4613 stop:4840 length:228 start_codon:yes stop_codon:yes gene_type:complete
MELAFIGRGAITKPCVNGKPVVASISYNKKIVVRNNAIIADKICTVGGKEDDVVTYATITHTGVTAILGKEFDAK